MAALFFVLGVSENALYTIHSWCSIKLAQHFKWLKSLCPTHSLFKYTVQGGYSNQRPGTCYLSLLRRRVNARNVSYTPYPTGDKHTISTLLIKPIFSVLAHAEKQFFSKLVFDMLLALMYVVSFRNPSELSHILQVFNVSATREKMGHIQTSTFFPIPFQGQIGVLKDSFITAKLMPASKWSSLLNQIHQNPFVKEPFLEIQSFSINQGHFAKTNRLPKTDEM